MGSESVKCLVKNVAAKILHGPKVSLEKFTEEKSMQNAKKLQIT